MENVIQQNRRDQKYQLGIIFGFIGLVMLIGARIVLWLHPPFPVCLFKEITGYPCPTCGVTRCLLELSQMHVWKSFLMNPLFFLTGIAIGIFALYSVGVYLLNFPQIDFERLRLKNVQLRYVAIALILLNWAYLILAHI